MVGRFSGHVQGVGFRMTAVQQSRGLKVNGFVRNEPDGSVLMDVEGTKRDLKELISRIQANTSGSISDKTIDRRDPLGREGGLSITY